VSTPENIIGVRIVGIAKFRPDAQYKQFGRAVHYFEINKSLVGQAFI
jgi:hypothetical protein